MLGCGSPSMSFGFHFHFFKASRASLSTWSLSDVVRRVTVETAVRGDL